ncbi:hypothetical protein MAPG_06252 [Magnaporthiopsis poae ATCC 64411]|uniref:ATP-dependent RNA helicase DHX8 n=1 Tax=Magnaporthiopsis poae (strain ATCC 64411 / 73-15) TaxID=644358 RepID=A0A0C4E1J0_MAGP6|nr:hypothetical protein MAPG_06252 [Magnaporthiopsis poae ATCC 64411]
MTSITTTTADTPCPPATDPPYRQIRALYDDETITVYQAYSAAIATEAVAAQRLDASPLFRTTRMTWIKPSWAWMLYRAGYSFKDAHQERILAIRVRRAYFLGLLAKAALTHAGSAHRRSAAAEMTKEQEVEMRKKEEVVKVQWDPERTVRLERLGYRSIQIGIPGALAADWVEAGIAGIEDVTERARELKRTLDREPKISDQELVGLGLVPVERPFEVSEELRELLEMRG